MTRSNMYANLITSEFVNLNIVVKLTYRKCLRGVKIKARFLKVYWKSYVLISVVTCLLVFFAFIFLFCLCLNAYLFGDALVMLTSIGKFRCLILLFVVLVNNTN